MSLFVFVSTMVRSAMDLKEASRLAFYDRLLHQSVVPEIVPETVDGLRDVNANGSTILPTESFVVCDQFFVLQDNAMQFESRWRNRMSRLAGCDGFVSSASSGGTSRRRDTASLQWGTMSRRT